MSSNYYNPTTEESAGDIPLEETDLATARESLVGLPLWRLAIMAVENGECVESVLGDAIDFATKDKVDGYVAVIERMAVEKKIADATVDAIMGEMVARQQKRSADFTRALETVKDRALGAMRIMGKKVLEGNTSTLKAKGVAPSCEVYDERKVPNEFWYGTVNGLDMALMRLLLDSIEQAMDHTEILKRANTAFDSGKVTLSIDKAALLKALKETCQACGGHGKLCVQTINPDGSRELVALYDPCAECNGTGKRQIPGARLVSDKMRLCVE